MNANDLKQKGRTTAKTVSPQKRSIVSNNSQKTQRKPLGIVPTQQNVANGGATRKVKDNKIDRGNKNKSKNIVREGQKNMITMSEDELNAILVTIGQLTKEKENLARSREFLAASNEDIRYISMGNDLTNQMQYQPVNQYQSPATTISSTNPLLGIPRSHMTVAERKRLEQQQINATVGTLTPQNGLPLPSFAYSAPPHSAPTAANSNITMLPTRPLIEAPLSMAEKKRLQWDMERAEQAVRQIAPPPWGGIRRGGGGDPIRDLSGNLLADYGTRRDQASHSAVTITSAGYSQQLATPPSVLSSAQYLNGVTGLVERDYGEGPVQPAAMRSAFSIGSLTADEKLFSTVQERQKKEWREELAKQILEDKARKEVERRRALGEGSSAWLDIASNQNQAWAEPRQQLANQKVSNVSNNNSAAVERTNSPTASQLITRGGGGGGLVDITTQMEQLEKKKKFLEYQEEIRRQIEERERNKKQEKEREISEDIKRATKELEQVELRDMTGAKIMIRKQLPQTRQDVETERQRTEVLHAALEKARLDAERDKHRRLVEKLQRNNHDISHLTNNPSFASVANANEKPAVSSSRSNAGVGSSVGMSQNNQNIQGGGGGYQENRVLTPSQHRGASDKKEFGTQTDSSPAVIRDLSRLSTEEIEFNPASIQRNTKSNTNLRKVHGASPPRAIKDKTVGKTLDSKTTTVNKTGESGATNGAKPKWSYNNTIGKAAVKQSEKDVGYARRQEARLARQQELMDMMRAEEHRVPRHRSRGKSQDRGREESPGRGGSIGGSPDKAGARGRRGNENSPGPKNSEFRGRSQDPSNDHGRLKPEPKSPPIHSKKNKLAGEGANTLRVSKGGKVPTGERNSELLYSHYNDDGGTASDRGDHFVPFVRSSNVLDPSRAESPPLQPSRETSEIDRARRGYQSALNPAKYGQPMNEGDGRLNQDQGITVDRQGKILQQLSEIRRALMEKQREAMRSASPSVRELSTPQQQHQQYNIGHIGYDRQRTLSPIVDT